MPPENEQYNAGPDWMRGIIIDHVPTETWMDGGLERAAAKIARLTKLRGEDATRAGLAAMAREGRLGLWLVDGGVL